MDNIFLSIDASTIDWSRAQFALTAIYHWLFVPLTLEEYRAEVQEEEYSGGMRR